MLYFCPIPKKRKQKLRLTPSELFLLCLAIGTTFIIDKHVYRIQLPQQEEANTTKIAFRFSPKGGCTQLICYAIDQAEDDIYVHAYSFTSKRIAKALLRAQKRGVHVHVIVDNNEYKRGKVPFDKEFEAHLTDFAIDPRHGKAHSKYMVIDEEHTITGSFNFDENAEKRNREDVVYITHAPQIAYKHLENWRKNRDGIIEYQKKKRKKK